MTGAEQVELWEQLQASADKDGMVWTAMSDDPDEANVRVPWGVAFRVEIARREREEMECGKPRKRGGR